MSSVAATPTLPVSRTVGEAFGTVPTNLLTLLRILWGWIALFLVAFACAVAYWEMWWPQHLRAKAPTAAFMVPVLLLFGLSFTGFASIAVAWHRLLLLGEQPPALYLRAGGQMPRYLGRLIIIGLICSAVQVVFGLVGFRTGLLAPPRPDLPPSPEDFLNNLLMGLVLSIPAIMIMSRLSISLPGIAIGRPLTLVRPCV